MRKLATNLPPLTWLRAFEAAARHLSFTRAASELNLTQSAVSQHVRNLESFLGRQLFIRKTRALDLTEAGASYLPVVSEAFDLIRKGTQSFTGGDRGQHLIIQCNLAFSVFWLAPRLSGLYERHPWIVLNIITPIWLPERHAAQAAMEIRFGRDDEMPANARRLTRDRFFPVCAPDYHQGKPDLETATLFDCAGMTGTWNAWFKGQGLNFKRSEEVNLVSTFVISISAALQGAGVTMAHDSIAERLLAEGRLMRVSTHSEPMQESYFLLPASRHASRASVDVFLDWLEGELTP